MVSHCGFYLHLSDGLWCWASFNMSLDPLYSFLGKVSVQVLCPFFNWVVCLPGVELCEFFIHFGDQTLVWSIVGKYVFPYSWLSFHFNAVFFSCAEAFYFDEIPFVYCSTGNFFIILYILWKLQFTLHFNPKVKWSGEPFNPYISWGQMSYLCFAHHDIY